MTTWTTNEEEAIKNIERISVGKNLEDIFKKIKSEKDAISSGFPSLDKSLGCGGFREGCLYAVGAGTSMGKTTFVTNIANNIASSVVDLSEKSDVEPQTEQNKQNSTWEIPDGKKVLIFSLETNLEEFVLKSLSKIMFEIDNPKKGLHSKTAMEIAWKIKTPKDDWEKELIQIYLKAIEIYLGYKDRIFIEGGVEKFGIRKIRRTLEYFEIMDKMPSLVIIDYLQLMDPFESGKFDLGYNISRNVTALKALCEEFKIPIILISSFNRENYLTEAGLESFKGSGDIEYSSDVVMALQPRLKKKEEDTYFKTSEYRKQKSKNKEEKNSLTQEAFKEAMRQTPRQIDLVILKNRHYSSWEKVKFEYYPMYDCFKEIIEEEEEEKAYFKLMEKYEYWIDKGSKQIVELRKMNPTKYGT
jgi:replicative DNA helicase